MAKSPSSAAQTDKQVAEKTVRLPQFERNAQVRSESFDAEANTIEIVWTTGASVRRYDYWDGIEYDEVLKVDADSVRLDRLNAGAPFLDTHCSYGLDNVIGSVVPGTAAVKDGRGIATIQLSKASGVADTVQKIREGVIRNISVGYWIHKVVKTEGDNGTVARWDVVDWEPLEVSAVPIPADPGSQVRSETQTDDGKGPALRSCVVVTETRSPARGPKPAHQEGNMSKRTTNTPAARNAATEAEAEKKRLAALRAAKRDEDKKGDDEDADSDDERDEDADEENAADDTAAKGDDDGDESRASDDDCDDTDDGEDGEEKKDDKRAAPSKRMTAADVRKAAEAAVRADRVRGAKIREIASQFGLPKLGERHANGETSVRAFKDLVLERLADRQKKRGNTTFAAAGTPELEDGFGARSTAAPAQARDFDKGAAEARALLGKK